MSYLSRIVYTGNGTVGPWAIPFSYIDKTHVKAYLNGTATTAFTWATDSSITFDEAPAAGVVIMIKRETPSDERLVEFQNASLTNSSNFNLEGDQDFYLVQEIIDSAGSDIMQPNESLNWEANNKTIQNLATPVNPTDAATRAYADGGNLEACEAQVVIATAQAGIATTKAAEAAQSAIDAEAAKDTLEGLLEPDGQTVKVATTMNGIRARVYLSSHTSLVGQLQDGIAILKFNAVSYDPNNIYNASTGWFTPGRAGVYCICANIRVDVTSNGFFDIYYAKNSGMGWRTWAQSWKNDYNHEDRTLHFMDTIVLDADDTISLWVNTNCAHSIWGDASQKSNFSIFQIA
jgi:hypothetical protein